ncbi:unnamed protein product [Penicillium olsonii]|nr:unnamed protein product [Penicillium olsonii]CAG7934021.1 unnamed protein product [Penicillium olsonii]
MTRFKIMANPSCVLLRTSPKIDIQLKQNQSAAEYYTTGDVVEGIVSITVPNDLPLGIVQIYLQGISKIRFHRALQHGRAKTQHTFLSLRHPQDEMKIPMPVITSKGHEYRIPFYFVLPEKLPSQSCNHFTKSEQIADSHMNLPATVGDPGCQTYINDSSSDKAYVSYRIRVKISNPLDDNSVLTNMKCIRVLPHSFEEPPLETMGNELYLTQRVKSLNTVPFSNSSGRLSIKALQPRAIRLPDLKTTIYEKVGTTVAIDLEFLGTQLPPKLRTISSTLKVLTIYGATPWGNHPNAMTLSSLGNGNRGVCSDVISLSKLCIDSVKWKKQDILLSDHESLPNASHENDSLPQLSKHISSIAVPITLPDTHSLVPTFHSCFISRVYLLEIRLSYCQHGTLRVPAHISLMVPLQITK